MNLPKEDSGTEFAVQVLAPGYQLVLRVRHDEDPQLEVEQQKAKVLARFSRLLTESGVYEDALDSAVRFGPGMYVKVLDEWSAFEASQAEAKRKQQLEQQQQEQRMIAAVAAGRGGVPLQGSPILMPRRGR
jgi:hypothetical protein